jgi:hypothetical protein
VLTLFLSLPQHTEQPAVLRGALHCCRAAMLVHEAPYLAHISAISPLYLPHISAISPLYLPDARARGASPAVRTLSLTLTLTRT